MPPRPLPTAADGLARAVAGVVIHITTSQQTSPSQSDVTRGVHEALRQGLTVVDHEFAAEVASQAHGRAAHGDGHTQGFCRPCAAIYEAVNRALTAYGTPPGATPTGSSGEGRS